MKKLLCLALALMLTLSFTAFAIDFTLLSSTVANGASAVYVKEGKITLTFSDEVNSATLSSITMGEDGETFADFTATLNGLTAVDITFGGDLKYSEDYVIYYSGLKNSSNVAITGTNSLSFTTEAEPDIKLESITLTKGIGSSVTEQTDGILEADSSIQGFKVALSNKADSAKTVNIVCALYNGNGIIKRVLTSEKAIDATATEMVELGTKIDASYAGGFAKIYIWDNVSNKTPFVGATRFEIQ